MSWQESLIIIALWSFCVFLYFHIGYKKGYAKGYLEGGVAGAKGILEVLLKNKTQPTDGETK